MQEERRKLNRRVSPAIGEFVLQERSELLATIARYETTADNCEVLRARLAKYEDAEGNPLAGVGGVDERAAFEAAAAETYKGWAVGRDVGDVYRTSSWTGNGYMNAYTDLAWALWKRARAALTASAPSHGEQVREVPSNCRQRLAAEGKAYPKSSCAVCGQFSPKWRECDAMLAATPSPSSQKEQGE